MSKKTNSGYVRRLYEGLFGSPKKDLAISPAKVAVLGVVEQSYGKYQTPSFYDMVTTLWNDPLLKESVTMFAEQVVTTGFFLTANPKYKFMLNGKSAYDVIKEWCDDNNIDIKLLEMSIELRAFGNSFWRIDSNLGFVKIPIEAVWHMIRVDPEVPLQEKYHLQLTPIYGSKVMEYGTFIHFRVGVTGYHAPFGQGMLMSLMARPVDAEGNVCPSVYDIRLSMRRSLDEGFRKFSFGNVWIGMPNLSNEDFEAQGIANQTAGMKSTGNRIVTNSDIKVALEVPERTQSYDGFVKNMRDEFFMSLADPTLKLGLEQGFTKATSATAADMYKYKVATMRQVIKQHFEDLFKQILDKQGYNGKEAGIQMNFGPAETPEYAVKDIFDAVKTGIILKNEARVLLARYHKWEIEGTIKGGDIPLAAPITLTPARAHPAPSGELAEPMKPSDNTPKKEATPEIIITKLPDCIAGYNRDFSHIYIDELVPEWMFPYLIFHEAFEYKERLLGKNLEQAHILATEAEHKQVVEHGKSWEEYNGIYLSLLPQVRNRKSNGPVDLDRSEGPIGVE